MVGEKWKIKWLLLPGPASCSALSGQCPASRGFLPCWLLKYPVDVLLTGRQIEGRGVVREGTGLHLIGQLIGVSSRVPLLASAGMTARSMTFFNSRIAFELRNPGEELPQSGFVIKKQNGDVPTDFSPYSCAFKSYLNTDFSP
jgi:hypothetical protein